MPPKKKYNHKRFGNTLRYTKENCFYCGVTLDDYSRTLDHLIPQCDGGIRSNDNKVYCCEECNRLKANMHPKQFVECLEAMIRFQKSKYTKIDGYLKKIRNKTQLMIKKQNKNGDKKNIRANRRK